MSNTGRAALKPFALSEILVVSSGEDAEVHAGLKTSGIYPKKSMRQIARSI
jgi:hypothetical protein